jgi:hypothetical protein
MRLGPPYQLARGSPGVWWIQGENDFYVAADKNGEVFRPDVLGWRKNRLPDPLRKGRGRWSRLGGEVISEENRDHDEVRKRAAYARIGVRWWGLVDPEARPLAAHVLEDGAWRLLGRYDGAARVRLAPFEAVELAMAEWRR